MGIIPTQIRRNNMSKNEYVIPSGKYKGLKTRAKTLEDAQRNIRAKIKRIESKLTRQEESLIQQALNLYAQNDFDDTDIGLDRDKALILRNRIESKLNFKMEWKDVISTDFSEI